MQIEDLKDAVRFDPQKVCYLYDDLEADRMGSAFLCYYLIKSGSMEKSTAYLDRMAYEAAEGQLSYLEKVLWLWVLGEYINETGQVGQLGKYITSIDSVLDEISRHWQVPGANWISPSGEGVYLSNIAMAYGALISINNSLRSDKAHQVLITIREFVFEKFLRGGRIVSQLGSDDIYGDICISAVPFALLDAGNQILVESVKILEKDLVSNGVRFSSSDTYYGGCNRCDLTCLLSWYYSERGDTARAKWLLDKAAAVWKREGKFCEVDIESRKEELYYRHWLDKKNGAIAESILGYVFYSIAKLNISTKEKTGAGAKGLLSILHSPTGTGNPYLFENVERYPRNPLEYENVKLKVITEPFNPNQKVSVKYLVNGTEEHAAPMRIMTSKEGEKYWSADIGGFSFGEAIKYWFEVDDESHVTNSEQYEFRVRKWHNLNKVMHTTNDSKGISVFFEPFPGSTKVPCLAMSRQGESGFNLTFGVKEPDDIPDDKNPSDSAGLKTGEYGLEFGSKAILLKSMLHNSESIFETYRSDDGFIDLLTDDRGLIYKIRYKLGMKPSDRFFGMGERYSEIEFRGLEIDNYVYNQYRDQGLRTYIPLPFTICSGGYGVFLDTSAYSVFRFGTRLSDMLEIEEEMDCIDQRSSMYIFTGDPKRIVQQFASISGKPVLPPKWAFGPWMSSNNWDSQAETCKQVELTKKYKIPATTLVLEQWSDEATFYIFNDARYDVKDGKDFLKYEDFTYPEWGRWPDPKAMVEKLHKDGLKVLLWQAPVQKFMDGVAHAQRDEDERAMLENGYHIKYGNGDAYRIPSFEWFKRSLVPDFTNPEAREWWLNKRLYLVKDIGIDGFKTDGGECVYGEDVWLFNGTSGSKARNFYPNAYIGSYNEFIKRYGKDDGITFSRAGYTGAQTIPMHWAGDERSTFEAFRASIRAGLSCGMSGIPFWGWDLAGFNGPIPTAELYVRAAEMAAFCPVMQYHAETKGEFNQDRTPWNIAERTGEAYAVEIYKQYADLRMNLLPYIYHQAQISSESGLPMMRSMFLEYPHDISCRELTGQYFFGECLLVAPVTEEGSSTKSVYFPKGKWLDLFTGEEVAGSRCSVVKAGLDRIPVYIRENSIIPLNLADCLELGSHIGNLVDEYQNLCFLVYVNDKLDYRFTDDLGNEVIITAIRIDNLNVKISLKSTLVNPITLIFRNIGGSVRVGDSDSLFSQVTKIEDLENGAYFLKAGSIFIRPFSKETELLLTQAWR